MKKALVSVAAICLTIAVFAFTFLAKSNSVVAKSSDAPASQTEVVTVSDSDKTSADADKILESRFLNMLNHNFVYDSTFDSVEDMVNESMPALLGYRDSEDDSYIAESYVADYIFDMYGIEIEDFSDINKDFENKEGYVYIIPRGFTKYNHTISDVTVNEDGSYTVTTKITTSSHDSGDTIDTCTTLFVPNAESTFGFSIIYSNIGGLTSAM